MVCSLRKVITLMILFLLLLSFFLNFRINRAEIVIADMGSTFKEIQNFFEGINLFISRISSITSMIGFNTILLFLFVIIFSAGFSAVGIPKGRTTFLASLITVDTIWIIWKLCFKEKFSDYFFPMLKSNLIVLTPLIVISLVKKIFPSLIMRLKRIFHVIKYRKRKFFNTSIMQELYEEYQLHSGNLNKTVMQDILNSDKSGKIYLSIDTQKNIESLNRTLSRFRLK